MDLLCDSSGELGLDHSAARDVVQLLSLEELDEAARHLPAESKALADLRRYFELLEAYGVRDRVRFDASVVRGLAYYTGIVFEAFDREGELRSICGGGRYDRLAETLGGRPLPAVGFGFGDSVIMELLGDRDRLPDLPRPVDDVVFALGEAQRAAAIRVAERLRASERSVELVLGGGRLKRAMADADRLGAERIWLLGPEEVERGRATVRELRSGNESEEPIDG